MRTHHYYNRNDELGGICLERRVTINALVGESDYRQSEFNKVQKEPESYCHLFTAKTVEAFNEQVAAALNPSLLDRFQKGPESSLVIAMFAFVRRTTFVS
ncbi:hypothetical protein ANOBCDAF_03329 [Pleomorphomonas sp. T1.2MG-36]|nr:hypothetical protein ANOBCDAF_03329 [Pleomorphomonas sp. T1.2MG-36]